MTDNVRADWHLSNWADFMQRGEVTIGYPRKSIGIASQSGRIHTFDDLANEVDDYSARVADRIINDMPPRLSCAIHNEYFATVWRNVAPLDEAIADFWARAEKAGLV